jgi:membrane protein
VRRRAARVTGWRGVVAARRVLTRYSAAGGGLLAGGLAYAALFALVPAIILLAGVVGVIFADPAQQAALVDLVVGVMPPLHELVEVVLGEAARDAGAVSVIGALILLWGASRFVVAFEDAVARVMGGGRRRGLIARNLGAIAAVLLLIGALLAGTILGGIAAFVEAGQAAGAIGVVGGALVIGLGLLPLLATVGAMILVYRIVPMPSPPWRATVIPGVAVGLAIALLARVFVYLAPRLIGAAALLGTLATVFAALAWLALSFQAVLLGAAWVRDRMDGLSPSGAGHLEA